jgi:transposase
MPRPISRDLKARVPVLQRRGYSVQQICDVLGIKKTLAYNILRFNRDYGTVFNPQGYQRRGRRRCLNGGDVTFLRVYIVQNPTALLDEIQLALCNCRGVHVTIPTVVRTLKQVAISKKQVSVRAVERNELLCAVFMNRLGALVRDPNMLMFLDESAKDERTSRRRSGWSIKGSRCIQSGRFVRGTRYSLLPVLTLDGIITHKVVEGSVTSEMFVNFLREFVVCRCLTFCPGVYSNPLFL